MISPQALTALLIVGLFSSSISAENTFINIQKHMVCFDQYLTERNDLSTKYEDAQFKCQTNGETKGSRRKQPVTAVNVDLDKQQLAKKTDEMCDNLTACNGISDIRSYLKCYAKTALKYVPESMDIYFNATFMVIELNDQYDEEEKEVMTCTLHVEQTFATDSFNALQKFLRCLKNQFQH